jgi:hypothetical protein
MRVTPGSGKQKGSSGKKEVSYGSVFSSLSRVTAEHPAFTITILALETKFGQAGLDSDLYLLREEEQNQRKGIEAPGKQAILPGVCTLSVPQQS